MTDIVEILSDLDGPITDEDRLNAAKELIKLRQDLKKSNDSILDAKKNTFFTMHEFMTMQKKYFDEISIRE